MVDKTNKAQPLKPAPPKINPLTGKPGIATFDSSDEIKSLPSSEDIKPRRWTRKTLALWLITIGLAIFLLPLYSLSFTLSQETQAMKTDLGAVQKSLTVVPTALPEVAKVLTPLAQVQGQINQVGTVYPTVIAPRPNWSAMMMAIGNYDPAQITLMSLSRSENRVTLNGQAIDDASAVAYARMLESSSLFSRVIVQSIQLVATPVVTPTATMTATVTPVRTATPVPTFPANPTMTRAPVPPTSTQVPTSVPASPTSTPSSTPDLRDAYEPDNVTPSNIALSQSQLHNFYPNNDVDLATFLAKSQRYYRVYTFDLAPGVDTNLDLQVGDQFLTNDDARPGSLYSEIIFQNTGPDAMALITVTNRGQYGSDKWYKLFVEEIIVAPTSAPSPTPTMTRPPTNTMVPPTNTPTSTPDLRDAYEPDDVTPRVIAVGEIQTHSFYPVNDIDKVAFSAKSGRYYQVLTSDLVLGVDTFLTVTLNNAQWTNDDYAPGTGNYASAVCFQAPQDGTAVATVTNNSKIYAPDKSYKIRVMEVSSVNAPPCVVVPTPSARNRWDDATMLRSVAWRQADAPLLPAFNVPATMVRFSIVLELKVSSP